MTKIKSSKKNAPIILNADNIPIAEEHLKRMDPILGEVITVHGPCTICERGEDPFEQLCVSIIGQQLSAKAAQTIRNRVLNCVGNFTPENIINVISEELRNNGLSWAKIKYIKALSGMVLKGEILFSDFFDKPSDEVITELIKVPGIGTWTAEMFLIFNLNHSNILSIGDAGLQRAVKKLYGQKYDLGKVGKKWKPYASVASWYLWRYLDATPGE